VFIVPTQSLPQDKLRKQPFYPIALRSVNDQLNFVSNLLIGVLAVVGYQIMQLMGSPWPKVVLVVLEKFRYQLIQNVRMRMFPISYVFKAPLSAGAGCFSPRNSLPDQLTLVPASTIAKAKSLTQCRN